VLASLNAAAHKLTVQLSNSVLLHSADSGEVPHMKHFKWHT